MLDPLPKFAQPSDTFALGRAGDQRRVDGPDRSSNDPVRFDAGFGESFIHSHLVSAERTSTLEHQHRLAECLRFCLDIGIHGLQSFHAAFA